MQNICNMVKFSASVTILLVLSLHNLILIAKHYIYTIKLEEASLSLEIREPASLKYLIENQIPEVKKFLGAFKHVRPLRWVNGSIDRKSVV